MGKPWTAEAVKEKMWFATKLEALSGTSADVGFSVDVSKGSSSSSNLFRTFKCSTEHYSKEGTSHKILETSVHFYYHS